MPFGYEDTRLWKITLGKVDDDPYEAERARLRSAYELLRSRAEILAREIPQDLRDFTVHDISHSDALWELADIIAGPELDMNAVEGFVLGGAFLLHDLGMGLAAWPDGMAGLTSTPEWPDILATEITQHRRPPPTADELAPPPDEVVVKAKKVALRELHAQRAGELAFMTWTVPGGTTYGLIDDVDLRKTCGRLIGKVAESHGWDIDRVAEDFPSVPYGAPPVGCPKSWTVDARKLACLFRLADAAHLDARRAPGFLHAIRKPQGAAADHWTFQERLQQPTADRDRLVFTAADDFELGEAQAWWLCFETLQMVNRELRAVDSFLVDSKHPQRMAVRSVKGAESAARLREFVGTKGWIPVDAHVTVSNVPELVRKLGGESLYGDDPEVALRELIQNAADATRALRKMREDISPQGIRVRLRKRGEDWWLSVEDFGVGMSQRVMTGPLLDFGNSFWGSELMRSELQGLAASGFRPTGKFGIGFYSVFMLGDLVEVTSKRFNEAEPDTRVLEFEDGLRSRPILRQARNDEMRHLGTVVSVRLKTDPFKRGGLFYDFSEIVSLKDLCLRLAPALDCDLSVAMGDEPWEKIISADDWIVAPVTELWPRFGDIPNELSEYIPVPVDLMARAMAPITDDGQSIARAALTPDAVAVRIDDKTDVALDGVLVSGGLSVTNIPGVAGLIPGSTTDAARSSGKIELPPDVVKEWADGQVDLWREVANADYRKASSYAGMLALFGAKIDGLKCFLVGGRRVDTRGLADWAGERSDVIVVGQVSLDIVEVDESSIAIWHNQSHRRVRIADDVCLVDEHSSVGRGEWSVWVDQYLENPWDLEFPFEGDQIPDGQVARRWWYHNQRQLSVRVFDAVSNAWGLDRDQALECMDFFGEHAMLGSFDDDGGGELEVYGGWRMKRGPHR